MEIKVEFQRSSSAHFGEALSVAESEPSFAMRHGPNGTTYTVSYAADALPRLRALLSVAANWRSLRLTVGGESVNLRRLYAFLDCYERGACSADPQGYCTGRGIHATGVGAVKQLFPCRRLPVSEGNHLGWFQYGRISKEKVFIVDKAKLREAVGDYLKRSLAWHCPLLDRNRLEDILVNLPERIDPRLDGNWVYKHGWHNGRYQVVGVEKRQREATPVSATPSAGAARIPDGQRDVPTVRYADVGGLDGELRRLREAIELPLKYPEMFERLGIRAHKGALLYGPPGTGKTLLAKALASECQANFILVNGPEIISQWHGQSEANLRALFAEAKETAPSVVLFDELDSIAPDRANVTHNFEAVTVSQLLSCMDGLEDRGQVVVIGTTNRVDNVDPAVKRPGRLDFLLEISPPGEEQRLAILKIHARAMPLAADVNLPALAKATDRFVGADLAALCREAGLECIRERFEGAPEGYDARLDPSEVGNMTVSAAHFDRALHLVVPTLDRHQRQPRR
ncbi:MAG: AAA family ATPase [Bacillota bacterium]